MFNTKCISNVAAKIQILSIYPFFFLQTENLKLSLIKIIFIDWVKQFGVVGLLQLWILPSHVVECPFQKFRYVRKYLSLYKRKRLILILKVAIKNLCSCTSRKTQYYFILDYRDVGEEVCVRIGRVCAKWISK